MEKKKNNNYLFFYKSRNILSDINIKGYNLLGRLDYNVPGILFFSKLKKNFIFRKEYYALVFGNFPIIKKKIFSICNGKVSISIINKKEYIQELSVSILKIYLITGRKNQIRKQLNFIGFPIVLDCKYGDFFLNKFFSKKKNIFLIYKKFYYLCYKYNIKYKKIKTKWLLQKKEKQGLKLIKKE